MKLVCCCCILLGAVSLSQAQAARLRSDESKGVRVTSNFQLSEPAPESADADMTKAMAQINERLYAIVNRQCDVLGAALKGSCRVVQVNVGSGFNGRMISNSPTLTGNASATFEIDTNAAPAPAQ